MSSLARPARARVGRLSPLDLRVVQHLLRPERVVGLAATAVLCVSVAALLVPAPNRAPFVLAALSGLTIVVGVIAMAVSRSGKTVDDDPDPSEAFRDMRARENLERVLAG